MALSQDSFYTIKDIYGLPEGERAELINGRIFYTTPPGRTHQRILLSLAIKISQYLENSSGAGEVFLSPFTVILNEDDRTYVEPDLCVICSNSKLSEEGCIGAPDWVIEVVSPGSKYIDYSTKLFAYRAAGVREYWIVDPLKNRITVYYFEKDRTEEFDFADHVPVGILSGFYINLA